MAYSVRPYNRVRFLLDGEEIFTALGRCFEMMARVPQGTPLTYVRMAFWLIEEGICVGNTAAFTRPDTNTLLARIAGVLHAGHNVDIIVWYPNRKHRRVSPEQQVDDHDALARGIADLNAQLELHPFPAGRARLYRERYEGITGSSQHQKFAIFSVNGQRTVVLGGLNMALRYLDNVNHTIQIDREHTNWHDTAVKITGPVTTDIEDEWMRRWRKVVAIAKAKVPTERLSNHLTAPGVDHQWRSAHAADIQENSTVQRLPVDTPDERFYALPAKVAVTRYSQPFNVCEIHQEIITRIHRARERIYFENNQFTDPDIVRALYQRMQEVPSLQVLIVTNPNQRGAGYLTRRAWLHLALRHPSCRRITFMCKDHPERQGTLTRVHGVPEWTVEDHYRPGRATQHQWLQTDCIIPSRTSAAYRDFGALHVKFEDIVDVEVDFHFLTPAVHLSAARNEINLRTLTIHSKLAIIDDWLVCGSANWTYRSMQYDGELSLFMQDQALATHTLVRLLRHYDPTMPLTTELTQAAIDQRARNLADSILIHPGRSVCPDRFVLLPLEYQSIHFDGALSLFYTLTDRVPGWKLRDLIRRRAQTLENIKQEAPNWRWW
ncbi:MAG TPA: phospholipase D-like domain-containing protein [Pseudomonadota bacterium]|nr:phospholipase D-like domain-containing protein [Pseudomonadota bacterium]